MYCYRIKSVNRTHIYRESKSRISKFSYTDVTNNMKLLLVVTQPSIYRGCSTWTTFWKGKFTPMNRKYSGRLNIRKHRDINNG